MKQGNASTSGPDGRKIEPRPHAMSPAGVSQIGQSLGNHATGTGRILNGASKELYAGKGFMAPDPVSCTSHKGGSQGRR